MTDWTHEPNLACWVDSANDPETDFPIQNLPFATFQRPGEEKLRVGVAIGDQVLDVSASFEVLTLRELMGWPREARLDLRHRICRFLSEYSPGAKEFLVPQDQVCLLLPCEVRNYTDFYASIDHATNVGRMFRPDRPLLPNYRWVPIAYHGRASSLVVSGTAIQRPWGQRQSGELDPEFLPTRSLDYEVELGAFLGPGNVHGETIPIGAAENHLFGVCLLNDWSARDVQAWEYQPLGPFLAKSFATSISPWVITLEALEPFRCAGPNRPEPLSYLHASDGAFAIKVEAWLKTSLMNHPVRLSRASFRSMYWTWQQMITHHASNGCPLLAGDLIGSGTISGPEPTNRGCLLELTERGAAPIELPSGEKRKFLEDGDTVTLRAFCERAGFRRIGFGSCTGVITPAHP